MSKLKFIIRGIIAYGYNAAISLIGLTIGLSCFTVIIVWAYAHWSFDRFHEDAENIYLVQNTDTLYNETDLVMPFPLAQALRERIPEMASTATITLWPDQYKIRNGETTHYLPITPVEEQIFDILDFDIIAKSGELFANPSGIALSETVAEKLFGSYECIGKTLVVNDSIFGQVGLVYADFPENSSFRPEVVCNYQLNKELFIHCSGWQNHCYATICRVPSNTDLDKVAQLITEMMVTEHEDQDQYALSPLTDYHINPIGEDSKESHLLMVLFSGLLVLVVSCINFVNLQTAINNKRQKQSAIKRMIGASAFDRLKESLQETVIYVFMGCLVSIFVCVTLLPNMSEIVDFDVLKVVSRSELLIINVLIAALVYILLATYMLLIIAKGNLNQSLLAKTKEGRLNRRSKVFIIAQFALAIFICITTIVMHKQIAFAIESDKGYDSTDLICVETWDYPFEENKVAIIDHLKHDVNVNSFSVCERGFNRLGSRTTGFKKADWSSDENNFYKVMYRCDENLLDVTGIQLITGRFFQPQQFNESTNIVVNETFAKQLGGVDKVVNTTLDNAGREFTIIGVCSDFLFESFYDKIEPLVMLYSKDWICGLLIKTQPGQYAKVAADLNDLMVSKSEAPFSIDPMQQLLSGLYDEEETQQKLLLLFSFLIIIISCLGLIGLTTFIIENSTKEIGIRKVNGAKVSEILLMINRDFIVWVSLAFLIAAPVAYFALNSWLSNFAYRIELSWWIFVVVAILSLLIALLTVSWQSWRAAKRNPIEALRYE